MFKQHQKQSALKPMSNTLKASNKRLSEDEELEDLPPLLEQEDDEQDDDSPPPLLDDDECDLPPLLDDDEEDDSDSPPPLLDDDDEETLHVKPVNSINQKALSSLTKQKTPQMVHTSPHVPKVSTSQTRDHDDLPALLTDDEETTDEEDNTEDLPPLEEDDIEDEEEEEDYFLDEDSDQEMTSSSDSGDERFFMRETPERRKPVFDMPFKPQPFSTIPNFQADPATEEKRRKEWEEYNQKKREEKLRRENLKKKKQELQEKQTKAATADNVPPPLPTNKPTSEAVNEAPIELGSCLNCTLGNKTITNKDEYYVCTCSNKCKLQFHKNCWLKFYRANRASDKSVACPTEACGGYIEDLFLYDREEQKTRTKCPAPSISSSTRQPPKKKSELFKATTASEESSSQTSKKKKKDKSEKFSVQQQAELIDDTTANATATDTCTAETEPSNTTTSTSATASTTSTTTTTDTSTSETFDESQIKVSVIGGKLAKAVEKKKLMDRALEETEKRKKKHLYKRTDFSIKAGNDVGIIVEIEPMRKVLTEYGYKKCNKEEFQLGDLIQFQIEEGNDYVRNIELIEQLETVPENFSDLHEQLKENLKIIKERFGVGIVFKFRSSKKKKSTTTSTSKQQKKSTNKATSDLQQQDGSVDYSVASSSSGNAMNTQTTAISPKTSEDSSRQGRNVAISNQEGRQIFTMENVSEFSSPSSAGSPWCLGIISEKKETFGKVQVSLFASSVPLALQQQETYFFHKMNVNKRSVDAQCGDFVIFTINEQNKAVTNIHVISNDLYEHYLTSN